MSETPTKDEDCTICGFSKTHTEEQRLAKEYNFSSKGSLHSIRLCIRLWCGFNPFYLMPDPPPYTLEICAHRKVLKHIKKREKYWIDSVPMGIQIKYIHMSHRKLRIIIDNGLGHKDFEGQYDI